MGVYAKAFVVLLGGLLGGSVGFYFQAKEEMKLGELRKIKLEEMRRLNQEVLAANDTVKDSSKKPQSSSN
ncbi:hypothetical protein J3B02_005174 [Coemansia erecta]|nr:hypothetical protein J3B02_005174 [Coemansia erecta]